MKVAIISAYPFHNSPPRGGVEGHVERLVKGLNQYGVVPTVVAPYRELNRGTDTAHVLRVPADQRLALPRRLHAWRRRVRDVLARLEPDVVHGHGLLTAGIAATDWTHGPSLVTAHGNIARDTLAVHSGLSGAVRARLALSLARHTTRRADAVIGVSSDWTVNVPQRPRCYVHIPPIVDSLFQQVPWAPEPGRVLFCGGSHPIKGWEVLSVAWRAVVAAIPHAHLDVVSWNGNPTEDNCRGTIRYRGHVDVRTLCTAMSRAAVVVVPSTFEVTPTVIAEAWTIGVPVIATAVGGIPAMADGAARLVPPGDVEALAGALMAVLCGSVSDSAMESRRRARSYTSRDIVRRHLALYGELLNGTRAGKASTALSGTSLCAHAYHGFRDHEPWGPLDRAG